MKLYSNDLPDLPVVTKELINTGNFRLYKTNSEYLLTMESTGDYFILSQSGKVIKTVNRLDKPKVKLSDSVRFSDLPSAPSLNDLVTSFA